MRARVVIGANFGDEGKGLATDYFCSLGAGMVVRFNGGAQAGHTVLTPDGRRHVFSHIGSGTLAGVPTFLSQFFISNPILFIDEYRTLIEMGVVPIVYAHPRGIVSTFADMIINQRLENARGAARHGSVGLGVSETVSRNALPHLRITVADLWNRVPLADKLKEICTNYAAFRTGSPITDKVDDMIEAYIKQCEKFANHVHPLGIQQCDEPVFEGAQGLLLSEDNTAMFPHVTRSKTGIHNALLLCEQAGITDIHAYYVSRTYLTRHGAGPLPGEDKSMSYDDDTNIPHPYQGTLRFAPLDTRDLEKRIREDAKGTPYSLFFTHSDQMVWPSRMIAPVTHISCGPTRNHVTDLSEAKRSKAVTI